MAKFEIVTPGTKPREEEKTIRVKFEISSDGRSILAYAVDENGYEIHCGKLFTLTSNGVSLHCEVGDRVGIARDARGRIAVL